MEELQIALPILSVDKRVELFFYAMANYDKLHDIKLIIDHHQLDVNVYWEAISMTPLIFAVSKNNIELVKFLISLGADVNLATPAQSVSNTAFKMALNNGPRSGEIAQYLLEMNADHTPLIDAEENNALLKAFQTGNWKIVSYMLNHQKYCSPKARNVHDQNVEDLIDYLSRKTDLPADLSLHFYDAAMWVGQNPKLVGVIKQWTCGDPTVVPSANP